MVQNDERAEKVAKYLALARSLREDSSERDYRLANSLAWELAMWMPADLYRMMGRTLCKPEVLGFIVAVRQFLFKDQAGDLGAQDIIYHAPGVGRDLRMSFIRRLIQILKPACP